MKRPKSQCWKWAPALALTLLVRAACGPTAWCEQLLLHTKRMYAEELHLAGSIGVRSCKRWLFSPTAPLQLPHHPCARIIAGYCDWCACRVLYLQLHILVGQYL